MKAARMRNGTLRAVSAEDHYVEHHENEQESHLTWERGSNALQLSFDFWGPNKRNLMCLLALEHHHSLTTVMKHVTRISYKQI